VLEAASEKIGIQQSCVEGAIRSAGPSKYDVMQKMYIGRLLGA
jgi:hypothetical protein